MDYSTWNPSDKAANLTLSNGNLTVTATNTVWKAVRGTVSVNNGKWYWEVTLTYAAGTNTMVGVGTSSEVLTYPGNTSQGYGYYSPDGNKYNGSGAVVYGNAYTTGDVVGVALDLVNGKIWWSKNGVWQDSGNPSDGTNEAYGGIIGTVYAMLGIYNMNTVVTANFGESSFIYSIPTGFNSGLFDFNGYFSGYTYEFGSPVQRTLYLHNRSSGDLLDTTTSSGNGYYYLETTSSGSHYIVCLDDAAGEDFNDLIIGDVYPQEVV